jgi:hypothetical protein
MRFLHLIFSVALFYISQRAPEWRTKTQKENYTLIIKDLQRETKILKKHKNSNSNIKAQTLHTPMERISLLVKHKKSNLNQAFIFSKNYPGFRMRRKLRISKQFS